MTFHFQMKSVCIAGWIEQGHMASYRVQIPVYLF